MNNGIEVNPMKIQMSFEEAVDQVGEAMIDVIGRMRDNFTMGSAEEDPLARNAKMAASMNDITQALLNLHELHEIVRESKSSEDLDESLTQLRPFME